MTIAVAGAGLGGMSAAIRLARAGHEVRVFEQTGATGGKAASVEAEGYRFDTGPSLVTLPFVFERLFEEAGESLERHLGLIPLDPLCVSFFPDGSVIRESSDAERFALEIETVTGEPAARTHAYLEHARRVYQAGSLFLYRSIHGILREGLTAREIAGLVHLDALRSFHNANRGWFRDPRVVQILDRFATFNGSDPYRAPATMAIIPAVEYGFGGFAVAGGIREIPRAYERVARGLGVRFELSTAVERVVVEEGRARGVVVRGERLPFDAVVSNVDARTTYRRLLTGHRDALGDRQEKLEPSISGIVFLWGMDTTYPELSTNNVFYSADYRREFVELFRKKQCATAPTVYVNVTSKTTPADAPPGCENWFVLVNAPANTGQDWAREVERTRRAVLARLALSLGHDVAGHIRVERVITPAEMEERTGSAGGSLYGIASNRRVTAFLRHPNRHPRIRGLYFCGGSVHPGGGMPLVTLSGMIAADQLVRHERGAR